MNRRAVVLFAAVGIVAALAAVLLPALQRARTAAQQSAAAVEVGQLDAAVGAFKARFGVDHLPCAGDAPGTGHFRLCSDYGSLDWPEARYLRRLFPQMSATDNGLRVGDRPVPHSSPLELDCNQVLTLLLCGPDGEGFSADPARPLAHGLRGVSRIGPFVSPSRPAVSRLIDRWGTPYAYFAWHPELNNYPPWVRFTWGDSVAWPTYTSAGMLHPRGWQIQSAGPDRIFGAYPDPSTPGICGGMWTPGAGDWRPQGPGADDLANFNAGPLLNRSP